MPKYLLSIHRTGEARSEPMTEEQQAASWQQIAELEAEMHRTGAWYFSGRLEEAEDAAVVRSSGGKILTTDGPFAETKEQIGGFYIIDAASPVEARAWAARVALATGEPVEVRGFMATSED